MNRAIRMHNNDSIAVVLCDIKKGDTLLIFDVNNNFLFEIMAQEDIPYGNKIALQYIEKNTNILKYNQPIGITTKNIDKGKLVHVHNVKSLSVDIPENIKLEIIKQMHITN